MLNQDRVLHNRYRIDRLHELGAVETIYLGWDNLSDTAVTISETRTEPNLLPDELESLKKQFMEQAQALCDLSHKHIIPPIDCFIIDTKDDANHQSIDPDESTTHSYVVTPAISYDSLSQRIEKRGTIPEKQVVIWAQHILDALVYCHGQNVLHGDIRPHNIFITPEGNATLTHFEVPTLWHSTDPRNWTAKRVLGTPDYAPPEKWTMRVTQIDQRSDLYSVGATLYHALTGQLPISAEERIADPYNFQNITFGTQKISAHVKNVITKSMAIPQEKRYASAGAMTAALRDKTLRGLYDIRPTVPSLMPPARRNAVNWRKFVGLFISSITLFVAAGIGLWLNNIVPPAKTWFSTPVPTVRESVEVPTATAVTIEIQLATQTPPPATLIPTATPAVTAELPIINLVPVISDTFESNTYAWPISDSRDEWGSILREITEDAYIWQVGADQDVGRWCLPDTDSYADNFRLSVEVKRRNGPLNIAYGLIIRHSEGRYYVFNARDDGYFRFSLWQGSEWVTIVDWTETQSIIAGEVNRLTVIAEDSLFEFYINDKYVGEAIDQEILAGDNGLSVIVLANPETAILEFDNFLLFTDNPR